MDRLIMSTFHADSAPSHVHYLRYYHFCLDGLIHDGVFQHRVQDSTGDCIDITQPHPT